ncbi:hypothetical protein GO001_27855 [Streptomyces sp. NRRL B-1677]|uniref:Uncharacterized protein n=1 Tax=Streptomyces klenkii TaxID=1420899 RepID=A0A3B0BUW6_9ACTN|nr:MULTISPECIES: hypothetical protein [Streptomyces]MBF6048974.1 hypothetical protein [Streptomyces sp. NRRL B-1677]RKN76261.1 hypothetical protein D7231_04415 [Streptomyces klenkii]
MPHASPHGAPHTGAHPDQPDRPDQPDHRRARALTGALAIAALVAALVALWQTQSTPLGGRAYCWGSWPEDEAPFRRGDRDRVADEIPPAPGHPSGQCSLRWHGGSGSGAYDQRLDLHLGSGPRDAGERRSWLGELFSGGDVPLPDGLPGFTAPASGTGALVLPESCDVDGRPSVVTLKSAKALSLATTGELLIRAANQAAKATSCTTLPPLHLRRAPSSPVSDRDPCGIAALEEEAGTGTGPPTNTDFHSCAIAGASSDTSTPSPAPTSAAAPTPTPHWAARFTTTARPRLVALFDGLTGDRPPAPGWRAHGSIDAAGALVRADCGGRPTVFAMRSGPARTHTRLDDPREVFPLYVDAVAAHMGCAPLRAG